MEGKKSPLSIGIVGLGLIGGSLAKTLHSRTDHHLLAQDSDQEILERALREGVVQEPLDIKSIARCEVLLLAIFPGAVVEWLEGHAAFIAPGAVVVDCAGTKERVCRVGEALAKRYGFLFVGGHPMAGMEKMGYAASLEGLFDGASLILVPGEEYPDRARNLAESLAREMGFGRVTYTTAAEHDRTIAYTSQLAHVVSSAYIKSPTAQNYVGFSAGSFRDMTRVAFLNEPMWTELFLENREPLLWEIRELLGHLQAYADALERGKREDLEALLRDGRLKKLLCDNRGI